MVQHYVTRSFHYLRQYRELFTHLMVCDPVLERPEVLTLVMCVKVNKRPVCLTDPVLPENLCVRMAHQCLSQHIHAMPDMALKDIRRITERAFSLLDVIIIVPVQSLTHQVQAMQVMFKLEKNWKAATERWVDFGVSWVETIMLCKMLWHDIVAIFLR